MKTASITETKNNLSALIDGLKSGPVLILDRGRPVARLEFAARDDDRDAHRADLIRRGVLIPAQRPFDMSLLDAPLPKFPGGVSLLQALLDEREEGY